MMSLENFSVGDSRNRNFDRLRSVLKVLPASGILAVKLSRIFVEKSFHTGKFAPDDCWHASAVLHGPPDNNYQPVFFVASI